MDAAADVAKTMFPDNNQKFALYIVAFFEHFCQITFILRKTAANPKTAAYFWDKKCTFRQEIKFR